MDETTKLSDEEIVKLVRISDKNLYSLIIKRYQGKLLRYANYLTADESVSADVVQESFIKAYVNLNGFDITKKFSSYLYRIVHNEAMNYFKKNKKQVLLGANEDLDSGINIEDDYVRKELKINMHKCLNQISIIYSEPLSLYFLEDKSYDEISDILRLPMGTVATRISRAKLIMKKLCKK